MIDSFWGRMLPVALIALSTCAFVDGGRDQEPAVPPVVRWEVDSPTAERDSHRTARDDHGRPTGTPNGNS